jgi:hypothetical protein
VKRETTIVPGGAPIKHTKLVGLREGNQAPPKVIDICIFCAAWRQVY